MSVWTTVVFEFGFNKKVLTRNIGKQACWEDLNDMTDEEMRYVFEHPEEYLPCGSEGTITWDKRNEFTLKGKKIVYFTEASGSIRDTEDDEGIVDWFRKKTEELKDSVVFAQIMARADYHSDPLVYVYDPEGVLPAYDRYDSMPTARTE